MSYEEHLKIWLGEQVAWQLIEKWEHSERLSQKEVKDRAARILGDVTGRSFAF